MNNLQYSDDFDYFMWDLEQKKFDILRALSSDPSYIRKVENRLFKMINGEEYTVSERAVFDVLREKEMYPFSSGNIMYKGRVI